MPPVEEDKKMHDLFREADRLMAVTFQKKGYMGHLHTTTIILVY